MQEFGKVYELIKAQISRASSVTLYVSLRACLLCKQRNPSVPLLTVQKEKHVV